MEDLVQNATKLLQKALDKAGVPDSHGVGHALCVLSHVDKALQESFLSDERALSCKLAALLHDADDKKYFPQGSSNGQDILSKVLHGHPSSKKIIAETLEMISYVSASDNGNTVPKRAKKEPEFLWPRFADRLEAIGMIGAVRCYQYNSEKGAPMFVETTPRCTTRKEVWKHVTPERLNKYMATKTSDSMMDHYFDKLLQIAKFDESVCQNNYLVKEASKRVDPLVQICKKFGKTGVPPIKLIISYMKDKPKAETKGSPKKIPLLRKQIQRKTIAKRTLKLCMLKQKKQEMKDQETQTYEINKKFVKQTTESDNYYKTTTRQFTTTMVVPSSIVDNAQSLELKTYLVGQIAKAAVIFNFNEVVIVSADKTKQMKMMQDLTTTDFFVQNLEYLETPQYLRKTLFQKSPALRFASLMNPLDAPHHMRANEWSPYREGVVMKRPVKDNKGSWANIGIYKDCQIDMALQEGTRVTVKLDQEDFNDKAKYYTGKVVSQDEPFQENGTYWGYQVRVAKNIEAVFKECPYEGGYDLKLGTSDKGKVIDFEDFSEYKDFKHALIFFGGLEGIEGLAELEEESNLRPQDVIEMFDMYLNTCPEQGCRTIRTEEAIVLSMAAILPKLRALGFSKAKK